MLALVLDRPRWQSVRRAFRVFTSLAVAVALALSGGALAGGLSAGKPPALAAGGLPVLGGPSPADRATADRVMIDRVEPVTGGPAVRSASRTGVGAVGQDPRDEAGTLLGAGPAGGAPVEVAASTATGQFPVRPPAGTDVGVAGSRAPPRR